MGDGGGRRDKKKFGGKMEKEDRIE